jgi:lipid A ethanolaminephosphotransferase
VAIEKVELKKYIIVLLVLVIVFIFNGRLDVVSYKYIIKNDTSRVVPLALFTSIANYLRTRAREEKIIKKSISKDFSYETNTEPSINILVIGESARSDRFSINGYKKETTPLLANVDNVISFVNAFSCDTSTLSSVPCLVSREGREVFRFPVKENSFVQVMADNGFDTYWITTQNEANTIHTFCKEARKCIDLSNYQYDMDALGKIKNIINNAHMDTLIVFHTMGSHINYNNRVPAENKKFKPYCKGALENCSNDTLDNSYDNTILYTDAVLSKIIGYLKGKNAFLLYTSDHGESLGEKYFPLGRRYGHASPYEIAPKEQKKVPFILWYSKVSKYASVLKNITNMDKHMTHDFIYHTMLGCSGFYSSYIDEELNLCAN